MGKKLFLMALSLFFVLLFFGYSFAEFTLSLNVPLYGQDTSYYCGPASGQMIMMGYPNTSSNCCNTQDFIYNTIQANLQDSGFYTDPDGLRATIMNLCPPPGGGHFVIFNSTNHDTVMHSMLYWMSNRRYPSATLINGGAHWVVVTGFQTDIDPRTGNAVLQSIDINDPAPQDFAPHDNPCTAVDEGNEGGTVRQVTGSSWFSNDWQNPNGFGTKWLNDYIAVVEPPAVKGSITAKEEIEKGEIISPKEALKLALKHVKERKLAEKTQFSFLNKTKPIRALLVNRNHKGYYIVLFEYKDRRTPGAVVLNAYTGEFQEIGAFPSPLEYLTEREAIKIALCSLRTTTLKKPSVELVYETSEQMRSRYRPVWKITIVMKEYKIIRYVSQIGEVFTEITPLLRGGD